MLRSDRRKIDRPLSDRSGHAMRQCSDRVVGRIANPSYLCSVELSLGLRRCLGRGVAFVSAAGAAVSARAGDVIPVPDFTEYTVPISVPAPVEHPAWEWLAVALLVVALGLASYMALVNRSRRGLFALAIASLVWFGFVRAGCVCPIGAIQNVALGLGDPGYVIPTAVLLIFLLPLVFTLFFGRTFCAGVCPLGAIQEVVAVRPIQVPRWLDHGLGLIPFVYLGVAVIYAVSATGFVICRYDPFVAMFRLSGDVNMLIFGGAVLLLGVFVGRPYCRYLCPLGAVLSLCSRTSKWHARIARGDCTQCRLCEDSCPYGAIQPPTRPESRQSRPAARRRLVGTLVLAPVLIVGGALLGSLLAVPLSRLHHDDRLAERVRQEDLGRVESTTDASEAFRNMGRPVHELFADVLGLRERFGTMGAWVGAWVGLVVGGKLIALAIRRKRTDYAPDRGRCVSCGRCYKYCPEEQVLLKNFGGESELEGSEEVETLEAVSR
jgi:NosR/NirI family transcriptional regulator, nitrous oxide reductase regulator